MTGSANCETSSDLNSLVAAVTSLMHHIQLINKIQLPKLNNDIAYLKVITERIVNQNEQILTKFPEKRNKEVSFRCRNLDLSPQRKNDKTSPERIETEATVENKLKGERSVGRRARRLRRDNSYHLRNMLVVMLNRSLKRSKKRKR